MGAVVERRGRSRGAGRTRSWMVLLVVLGLLAGACGGAEETAADTAADTATEAGGDAADTAADATAEAPSDAAAEETSDAAAEETDAGTAAGDAETAAAASCYEGQTATFVVSFDAGGGYDQIARIMAPFLEEELGATVVVENQPGAGGLLAMNSLLTSDPDGLRFAFFTGQGIVGAVIGGGQGADFELLDFTFIGRVGADQRVLAVPGSSEYQTIEDVQAAQGLKYATAGPGASDYIDATVLGPVLGLDREIITGFEGSAETELALTTGEVALASGTVGSRLNAIESGDHRPVLALGDERVDEFSDVPALTELELSEENLAIAETYNDLQEMGRMIWAPPGVPEECATELTDAIETVLADPELQSQMEAADQEIDFVRGDEMRTTAEGILDGPEPFVTLLQEAYAGQ